MKTIICWTPLLTGTGKVELRNFYGAPDGSEDNKGYFVVRQLDVNDEETKYRYDLSNRVTTITAPDGGVTEHHYDEKYRFIKEVDPLGPFHGLSLQR